MGIAGDALPAPPARERAMVPVLAVVSVLVAVVFGGYVSAAALAGSEAGPVDVAGLVRIEPPPGWELASRSADPPGARLTRGNATLDVLAGPFDGTALDLVEEYVTGGLEPQAEQLSVSQIEIVEAAAGLVGARVSYVGTFGDVQVPIEGEVTTIVSGSGVGAIFDGWAPSGQLRSVQGDVRAMVETAELA